MKSKLMMTAAVAVVMGLGLASCAGEDAKLAGELAGTWKGETVSMKKEAKDKTDKDGKRDERGRRDEVQMSCTPTFTFVRTDGTNGGTVDISAGYTLTRGVESAAVAVPVAATVNGTITASGTWMAEDGDEVRLTLDPTKTVVDVDTASMTLNYAQVTDAPRDSLASIRNNVAVNIADVVKPMLAAKVQKMRKLDDVKITGNTMTLEAGHNKVSFTKQ